MRLAEKDQRKLFKSFLSNNHFQDWLKDHIEHGCGLYSRSMRDNGNFVYYAEGRRSIGLDLLELIQSIANEEKIDYPKLNIYYKR